MGAFALLAGLAIAARYLEPGPTPAEAMAAWRRMLRRIEKLEGRGADDGTALEEGCPRESRRMSSVFDKATRHHTSVYPFCAVPEHRRKTCQFLSAGRHRGDSLTKILKTEYGCTGHGFAPASPADKDKNVRASGFGFSHNGNPIRAVNRSMRAQTTLPSLRRWMMEKKQVVTHDGYFDLVKVDCEGCEYRIVESVLKEDPHFFRNVGQFVVIFNLADANARKDNRTALGIPRLVWLLEREDMLVQWGTRTSGSCGHTDVDPCVRLLSGWPSCAAGAGKVCPRLVFHRRDLGKAGPPVPTPAPPTDPLGVMLMDWSITQWLMYLAKRKARLGYPATFIQVGANDGVYMDPLYDTMKMDFQAWVGLLVEPSSFNFQRLTQLHKDRVSQGWSFAQVVMSDSCEASETTFYEFPQTVAIENWDPAKAPISTKVVPSYIQLGQGNGLTERKGLKPKRIPCIDSVVQLVEKYASPTMKALLELSGRQEGSRACFPSSSVDLLQIDCEMHDWRVIQALDFSVLRPHIIHFEGYGPVEKALKRLMPQQYFTRAIGNDVLAVDYKSLRGWLSDTGCQF
eukprot:Hpha_TRINITY_DN35813_c0_g1::TRINITY_DN35813_c0_g1_i1::g.85006::m.85006